MVFKIIEDRLKFEIEWLEKEIKKFTCKKSICSFLKKICERKKQLGLKDSRCDD